jgi:hypothetical protein
MDYTNITNKIGTSIGMIILVIFIFMILLYVFYHLYSLISRTALTTTTVLASPLKITKSENKVIGENVTYSTAINGMEYSYSFWMYIENIENTIEKKHVISRGNNPLILLDNNTNKLKVMVGVSESINENINQTPQIIDENKYHVMTIDYVPIQRWVNIVIVMDNDFVTLYMDGEIYSVANLLNQTDSDGENKILSISNGLMSVGSKGGNQGYDGYISKVQYFNYALTIEHARAIYKSGPVKKTILSAVGLPLYGIRNPFYKVDTLEDI